MKTLVIIALAASTAAVVSATEIRSGFITITGTGVTGSFGLIGGGLFYSGTFTSGNWGPASCTPCAPGTMLNVNGTVLGGDFGLGSLFLVVPQTLISGLNWGDINAASGSVFNLTGAPILIDAPGTYLRPISLSGALCGTTATGAGVHPCVVSDSLTGVGTVKIEIASSPNGLLQYTSATYFIAPEPGTFWPIAMGLVGLGITFKNRMRK